MRRDSWQTAKELADVLDCAEYTVGEAYRHGHLCRGFKILRRAAVFSDRVDLTDRGHARPGQIMYLYRAVCQDDQQCSIPHTSNVDSITDEAAAKDGRIAELEAQIAQWHVTSGRQAETTELLRSEIEQLEVELRGALDGKAALSEAYEEERRANEQLQDEVANLSGELERLRAKFRAASVKNAKMEVDQGPDNFAAVRTLHRIFERHPQIAVELLLENK